MHILSHISYPYILVNGLAILLGIKIPWQYNLVLILFSLFPDSDVALNFIKQMFTKGKFDLPPKHHQNATHWPIVYVPLLAVALITMEPFFLIAIGAIIIHLFMDIFYCSQGVMLFYPFSTKWYYLLSDKTKDKDGWEWNNTYKHLKVYLLDKSATFLLLLHVAIIALR